MSRKARRARKILRGYVGATQIVQVGREHRFGRSIDGFVLAVGKKWALLACTSDGGYHDGLVAVKVRDITEVKLNSSFETRFAVTRPEWPVEIADDLNLDDLDSVMWFFAARYSILGIRQEAKFDGFWIGYLNGMDAKMLLLHELAPDASWREHSRWFAKKHVTSVEGGGHYLTALQEVASPERAER